MSKIREIIDGLSNSEPVFTLKLGSDSSSVRAKVINPYYPSHDEKDVLLELVARRWSEYFSADYQRFVTDKKEVQLSCYKEIRESIAKFLEKSLEMRAPRQSKLYKWVKYEMDFADTNRADMLIFLYKYLRSFCYADMQPHKKDHAKNAIALIEAIQRKYGN